MGSEKEFGREKDGKREGWISHHAQPWAVNVSRVSFCLRLSSELRSRTNPSSSLHRSCASVALEYCIIIHYLFVSLLEVNAWSTKHRMLSEEFSSNGPWNRRIFFSPFYIFFGRGFENLRTQIVLILRILTWFEVLIANIIVEISQIRSSLPKS